MFSRYSYATVTDTRDPDSLGRVRVKPLGKEEALSGWLPVGSPFTGRKSMLPETGDTVIVVSAGMPHVPELVIDAAWFVAGPSPQSGETAQKSIKTCQGNTITLDATGVNLHIVSADGTICFEYSSAAEEVTLTIEKDITLSPEGKIIIEAGEIQIDTCGGQPLKK
ncbi:MAG: phage baseplate assembly protein V [Spirochaetales bacterium]|nr:phage baseplate assembly protein V [Spirochaetales bacterium]